MNAPCLPLLSLPRHDPFVGALIVAGFEAARGLTPRRHRMTTAAGFALAAAVRVIDRIHRYAAVMRHLTHPAFTSRLTQAHVFVLDVTHLAHGCNAFDQHLAHLARWKLQLRIIAFS